MYSGLSYSETLILVDGGPQGDYETNMDEDSTNAVTWGVFPGHEIAQSTIIERENFLSWKVNIYLRYLRYRHMIKSALLWY